MQVVLVEGVLGAVVAAHHAAAAEGAARALRALAAEEGIRHGFAGLAEVDRHVRLLEGVIPAQLPAHRAQHLVGVGEAGVPGGPQHAQGRLVVGGQLLFPAGQVGPGGRREEGVLGHRQGVGVYQRAAAHAHAREGRHMAQEGHLEEAPEAHLGQPEEALQVPVRLGEVARAQAPALLEHQHLVALLRER